MNAEDNGANIPVASESSPLLYSDAKDVGTAVKDVALEFASGDSASVEHSGKESDSKTFLSQTEELPIPSTQRLYSRHESTPKVSFILGQFNYFS